MEGAGACVESPTTLLFGGLTTLSISQQTYFVDEKIQTKTKSPAKAKASKQKSKRNPPLQTAPLLNELLKFSVPVAKRKLLFEIQRTQNPLPQHYQVPNLPSQPLPQFNITDVKVTLVRQDKKTPYPNQSIFTKETEQRKRKGKRPCTISSLTNGSTKI